MAGFERIRRSLAVAGLLSVGSGGSLISAAGAPTDGTSGTGAGDAAPGSIYYDTTNGFLYQNSGTKAAPRWKMLNGYAVKQVTDTQMKALLGTDIELVPTPGAGKAILVESAYMVFDVTTTGYTLGTAALAIGYGTDNGDIIAITEAGFLDQTTDQIRHYYPTVNPVTPVANVGVVLRSTVADLTGGNAANTLSILTKYRVVPTTAFPA